MVSGLAPLRYLLRAERETGLIVTVCVTFSYRSLNCVPPPVPCPESFRAAGLYPR
jgi:hypothetical protein